MRRRRQADQQQLGGGIPETGYRPGPIRLFAKGGALFASNLLAPCHQARALATVDDLLADALQRVAHTVDYSTQKLCCGSSLASPVQQDRTTACASWKCSKSIARTWKRI